MKINVYDAKWQRLILSLHDSDVSSLLWTKRFREPGYFEIVLPLSPGSGSPIRPGMILDGIDPAGTMIVESTTISTKIEEGDFITIRGRGIEILLKFLAPRTISPFYRLDGSCNEMIRRTLKLCSADQLQPYPIRYEDNPELNQWIFPTNYDSSQFMYGGRSPTDKILDVSPLDLLQKLSDYVYDPFGIRLIRSGNELVLTTYQGIDRSKDIEFSEANGNLISSEYTYSIEDTVNEIYAASGGQNPGATVIAPGDGVDHKTVNIQVRRGDMLPKIDPQDPNWQEICQAAARSEIAKHKPIFEFVAEISGLTPEYGKDYGLGDIVSIDNGHGVNFRARVTEMTYTEDSGGRWFHPVLEVEV